jgi:hypothetical protein
MGRQKELSGQVSTAVLFHKAANKMVVIPTAHGRASMTNWEGLVRMVQNLALDGNPRAVRLLSQMRKKFPGKPAPPGKIIRVMEDEDLEL